MIKEIARPKNHVRKIDEECLKLYGLVQKATEKLESKISNFEEQECEKSVKVERKLLSNMDQVTDIVKLNLLKVQSCKL